METVSLWLLSQPSSNTGPYSSTQTKRLARSDAAARLDDTGPAAEPAQQARTELPQQEQRHIHGLALRPTPRSVRQLHKTEGDHEPVCPDQDGRDASQPVWVESHQRRAAHPEGAGGCPGWVKAPALARRLGHLLSGMRVSTWSVWWSRRCDYDY